MLALLCIGLQKSSAGWWTYVLFMGFSEETVGDNVSSLLSGFDWRSIENSMKKNLGLRWFIQANNGFSIKMRFRKKCEINGYLCYVSFKWHL